MTGIVSAHPNENVPQAGPLPEKEIIHEGHKKAQRNAKTNSLLLACPVLRGSYLLFPIEP